MLTLSQIKYCGELCFDNNLTALNSLQVQFYKRFCHLKITTQSYCIFGEFGVKPIEFHFYKAALTYWVRLITSENKNWINLVYDRILENINDHKFSKTWCSRIKTLLCDLQLSQLWENQMQAHAALYINVIKRRLEERFREKWIESAKHSHKGMNYLEICRFDCEMKSYLNFITKGENINIFLKLRAGNHTLSVEVDRYRNRKTYEECVCLECDSNKIEDLFHVIVECPKYTTTREHKLKFLLGCDKTQFNDKFSKLSPSQLNQIIHYMDVVTDVRKK